MDRYARTAPAMQWCGSLVCAPAITGDMACFDRIIGVYGWSSPVNGLAAYQRMKVLSPDYITVIHSHGEPGDLTLSGHQEPCQNA